VDLEGLDEKGFQAWSRTPCEYLEGGSAGQNGAGGRWTSGMCQCEGREGVQQDGADRYWKVRWKTSE
jgi:hypothetical protein